MSETCQQCQQCQCKQKDLDAISIFVNDLKTGGELAQALEKIYNLDRATEKAGAR